MFLTFKKYTYRCTQKYILFKINEDKFLYFSLLTSIPTKYFSKIYIYIEDWKLVKEVNQSDLSSVLLLH